MIPARPLRGRRPPPPPDGVISDRRHADRGVAAIRQSGHRATLSVELVDAVGDRLQAAQDDDAVRAVVLTNAGNTFARAPT